MSKQTMNTVICLKKWTLWILLGTVCLFIAASCGQNDEVAVIRNQIQKGATLAEAHDINGLMRLTADDIVVNPGGYNRRETKRIIWAVLRHYGNIKIIYPRPSVNLSTDKNQASCGLVFLIVKKNRVIPDVKDLYDDPQAWIETVGANADLYRIKLEMVKTDNLWQVTGAYLETFPFND
jgi:hypothetical protein